LGIGLDDLGFDEPWIVADTLVEAPVKMPDLIGAPEGVNMQEVMFIIGDPARPTSVIPGVGNHRRWEFMMLPGETPEQFADPAAMKSLLNPWVGDVPYTLVRFAVYRFHALLAKAWRQGRVFLAGDAAHQTPPFFGQGLCHGIRDVANWAWKIKLVLDCTAAPTLLDAYEVERLPQVRAIVEASMRVGRYVCTLDPELAKRRDGEMRAVALRTTPGYVDIIPALTAGLLDDADRGSTAVGSRFIQPPVLDQGGVPILLDYATGGGFVMLDRLTGDGSDLRLDDAFESAIGLRRFRIVTTGEAQRQQANTLVDHTEELTAWFDHFKCRGVLLRPDAYVFGTYSTSEEAVTMLRKLRDGVLSPLDARLCVPNRTLRASVND
jgi:3-(3-hydroxy-phenyl)propionate hydroxylase